MFSDIWRQQFHKLYNEMRQCGDEKRIRALEQELQELMRQEEKVIGDHLRKSLVPETVNEKLLEDASRWRSLRVFHERDIHLEPDFYMLGWVLSYKDLFKFQQGSSNTFRGVAQRGVVLSSRVAEFLDWMEEGLRKNNAMHLYDILENYCYRQPWELCCVREDEYWVLFFYACAHAVYAISEKDRRYENPQNA